MTLNVKDPEAHRLATAIAQTTGDSMSHVVTETLREYYERVQSRRRKPTANELLAIAQRARAGRKRPFPDHAALLYDERGLPK